MRIVLSRLREANLRLAQEKCTLTESSVTFLGHLVSEDGLQPDPRLLDSIRDIQPSVTVSQVYYWQFIKGFSNIDAPLNRLLEKNKPLKWTDECMAAYENLKVVLLQRPVVAYPDFSISFRPYIDASNVGLRAIPAQQQEGKERNICCASSNRTTVPPRRSA